jgi:hypothetical protein
MIPDVPYLAQTRTAVAQAIREQGGQFLLEWSSTCQYIVAVDTSWIKVTNIIEKMKSESISDRDVLHVDWVLDSAASGILLPLEPR